MFLSTFTIAIVLGGDPVPAPKSAPRFEFSRLYQWMFAKRPATAAESATPKPTKGGDELSDARIELRCRNSVFNEPALRNSGMTVRAADGVVYLEGSAATRWLRIRAEQLAAKTPGVIRVENNLRISEAIEQPSAEPTEPPRETDSLKTSAAPAVNWEVLASRPKTLAADGGEPIVTTYAIRRAKDSQPSMNPTSGQAAAPIKSGTGKLIPWDESQPLPTPAGEPIPRAIPKRERAENQIDETIRRILADSPSAKGLSFDRNGGEVALQGSAPTNVLFSIARQVGEVPGVAIVSLNGK